MDKAVVFGDIHGMADQLEVQINVAKLSFGPDVALFHVGDLIDRGPDSKRVIQLCIDHNIRGPHGNHEIWFKQMCQLGILDTMALHPIMGGRATIESYGIDPNRGIGHIEDELPKTIPQEHKDYILSLPKWMRLNFAGRSFRLIHGGMKEIDGTAFRGAAEKIAAAEGISIDDAICEAVTRFAPSNVLWKGPHMGSTHPDLNLYRFGDGSVQIFGHVPQSEVRISKRWISVDTGCGTCDPHKLSAVVIPDMVPL